MKKFTRLCSQLESSQNSPKQDGDKMAAAVPENKSLQDRINALHIQLKEANEEKEKPSLALGLENDGRKKPRPGK